MLVILEARLLQFSQTRVEFSYHVNLISSVMVDGKILIMYVTYVCLYV